MKQEKKKQLRPERSRGSKERRTGNIERKQTM